MRREKGKAEAPGTLVRRQPSGKCYRIRTVGAFWIVK